ncbi:PA0069 family radical SAM protein [uncultured Arcticibacterium sp.]|uniref:PA0069 family radical SAM protein n=1 Tax=uncultured Arcticibacterium sp. TaxID=2173042 RepID=UPI0030F9D2FB
MSEIPKIKGRGAQLNSNNRFLANTTEYNEDFAYGDEINFRTRKTKYLTENPKKIVNKIVSPDVPNGVSVNPYQGCEHGCIYCYARNTHEYYGYSAGLDFEQKILVKKNAPELLEKELQKKSWKVTPILFSGNTDCYQPAEKNFKLTRRMLEICLKYRNPVAIITKNALILRDIDILGQLSKLDLLHVIVSLTTLNEELRRALEPRTVSGLKRLQIIKKLSENGIPVGVNTAPIIPSLNDHEIPELIKNAAENGACSAGYTMVRLNGSIAQIFTDWIYKTFPNKAEKVLNQIKECHGGTLNDSQFGRRMRGEGKYAEHIKQLHKISCQKYLAGRSFPAYSYDAFMRNGQFGLF